MALQDHRYDRNVLLVAAIVVAAAWVAAASDPGGAWAVLFDNLHWTLSTLVSAWLVWHGSTPGERAERRHFVLAAIVLALGEIVFDVQVCLDWVPFPAPSDAFFMAQGTLFVLGFAKSLRALLPAARQRLVLLDMGGFALAVLALTLTLYLPYGRNSSTLQMSGFVAYPVIMLSAVASALMVQLHLRQRWTARWNAFFGGLCLQGAMWMAWNLEALNGSLGNGTLTNLGFSIANLSLGWGLAGWRMRTDPSPRFDRLCEGLLRQLPLAMVALGSAAIGLLRLDTAIPEASRTPLLGLGLGVLLFAVFRQTQQLGERDRLIEAERVAAESQARLHHLAHHDPMTGLPNLVLLRDRVEQAIRTARRQGTRTALMFVDLDQFKEVNDTLGHATGDALLCHIARELRGQLRGSDTVSRQGGDEFTLVIPDAGSVEDVARIAEKIMAISGGTAHVNGHELPMSMSVGIALYPDDADDLSSLMQRADMAMYHAKAAGRNAYRFYDAFMNAEASQRIQLRSRLSHAVERGELQLHYQAQIDLASGRICGVEALLRWNSRELGPVPPASFIPVAEDSGQIVEIGGWVLGEACRQAAAWKHMGLPPLPVAVNISMLQFQRGSLERQVIEALRGSGFPAHLLELEVTESVMMRDQDRVIRTIERLNELGVTFAIDDFGTGYSSLSYVRRMRVGKLKIDRSFVQNAVEDAGNAGVVRAMIEMARALDVVTVAEGVESDAQLAFLRECRCDAGQGFLFTRPLPGDAFERFVARHPPARFRAAAPSADERIGGR